MPETQKPTFEFAGFRLDSAILQHQGALVPLSPKAIDLLYLLVSRAPETVTKEEFFDAVWPGTFVVESSLARNISVIRKALEERAAGPFIETIPKRGYRFVAPVGGAAAGTPLEAQPLPPAPADGRRKLALWATLPLLAAGGWYWARPAAPAAAQDDSEKIGRHLLTKGTPAEATKALHYFEKAVRERPTSASAHGGLAEALSILPGLAVGDRRELLRAREEAQLALKLDARLASGHIALGATQLILDWDFPAAERSYRQALQSDPASVNAHVFYATFLTFSRRYDEAASLLHKARQLDPVSPLLGVSTGRNYYEQGKYGSAAAEFHAVLDRESHYALAHYYLGLSYAFLGRFEEADRHLASAELNPQVLRTDRAWLRLRQGDPTPAREVYTEILRLTQTGEIGPSSPLLLAVALADERQSIASFEAALKARALDLLPIRTDPRLEALRRHPRYRELLKRAGLPE